MDKEHVELISVQYTEMSIHGQDRYHYRETHIDKSILKLKDSILISTDTIAKIRKFIDVEHSYKIDIQSINLKNVKEDKFEVLMDGINNIGIKIDNSEFRNVVFNLRCATSAMSNLSARIENSNIHKLEIIKLNMGRVNISNCTINKIQNECQNSLLFYVEITNSLINEYICKNAYAITNLDSHCDSIKTIKLKCDRLMKNELDWMISTPAIFEYSIGEIDITESELHDEKEYKDIRINNIHKIYKGLVPYGEMQVYVKRDSKIEEYLRDIHKYSGYVTVAEDNRQMNRVKAICEKYVLAIIKE